MKMREILCAECKKLIGFTDNFKGIGYIACVKCEAWWRDLNGF